jgi:hypothetical protein
MNDVICTPSTVLRRILSNWLLAATTSLLCFACLILTAGLAAAAPHWGDFQADYCRGENAAGKGLHQYSAVLWNIPSGVSWEDTCKATPATVQDQYFSKPTRCVNVGPGINMWGEFDVIDPSCNVDREWVEDEIGTLMGASFTCDWSQWTSDGCSVPGADPTSRWYRTLFQSACVFHDYCYAAPWGDQSDGQRFQTDSLRQLACDVQFHREMWKACNSDSPCNTAANAWYDLMRSFAGSSSYAKAQKAILDERVKCTVYIRFTLAGVLEKGT